MKNTNTLARKTSVINELGMHARPASRIAQMALDAKSDVWLCTDDTRVDASSIIDILTLCAVKGTDVEVKIDNPDDRAVLDQIVAFFEDGFGEL
ncbi:MAG: HPr family phosphocarrier protein [Proteobacteria bacterium]|nr:HPr family phosphocarrier protein [Pseudomonadota bacterium]MBU1389877.1 HPr family phosphocarrier protein [Pseudomonadota bacterium]MBU1543886.1 HPr family phosphocarrier protein [Pseudomonadota bacterium]MBU2431254.1 HPr family phosphocarrier protein [Pseudomonadota bacterium]MBU2482239.1 HPr family phosphocarrier protein [Pseudomonadota bacterium]